MAKQDPGNQNSFFVGSAVPVPAVKGGNKFDVRGGQSATADRLPTEEIVSVAGAPGVGEKVTAKITGPGGK